MFLFNFGFVSTPSDVLSSSSRVWAFGQNQHRIIIITATVIVIFNLPAVLTYCLGRISTKNLCGRTQRGQRRLCVWVRSAHAGLDLHVLACGRLASGPFFEMLEGPQGGDGLQNLWGFWWWIHPAPLVFRFLQSYFLKGLEGSGMSFLCSLRYCFLRWSAICVTGCGS